MMAKDGKFILIAELLRWKVAEHQALKIAIDEEETLTVAKVVFWDLRFIG